MNPEWFFPMASTFPSNIENRAIAGEEYWRKRSRCVRTSFSLPQNICYLNTTELNALLLLLLPAMVWSLFCLMNSTTNYHLFVLLLFVTQRERIPYPSLLVAAITVNNNLVLYLVDLLLLVCLGRWGPLFLVGIGTVLIGGFRALFLYFLLLLLLSLVIHVWNDRWWYPFLICSVDIIITIVIVIFIVIAIIVVTLLAIWWWCLLNRFCIGELFRLVVFDGFTNQGLVSMDTGEL